MNFLDPYDITRTATPNPTAQSEQPSLNEEVSQVIGQLGRFWGGFRKQSQNAFEAARKDLNQVVVQAQKEISKFTAADEASQPPPDRNDQEAEPSVIAGSSTPASTSEASTSLSSAQTLFSRLQSALPPNIVATVQNNIPETLKHASEHIDLQQIRSNLLSELERVQGVTRAQAEEYAHKSEALLREAIKEAGEALREVVKVIPPDQAGPSVENSALMWDGTDMWLLPSDYNESNAGGREGSSSRGLETQNAVASRAEALLRRLKHDPDIMRHDPESEEGVKEQYLKWKQQEVDILHGGMKGSVWSEKIHAALQDSADGPALKKLESMLVPSEISKESFWLRFFFRTHQIRVEEERRKILLRGTNIENEEDFSWEDDEEENAPASTKPHTPEMSNSLDEKVKKENLSILAPEITTKGAITTSRRGSSEDSFDLVSSAGASVTGDENPAKAKPEDEGEDSDWE